MQLSLHMRLRVSFSLRFHFFASFRFRVKSYSGHKPPLVYLEATLGMGGVRVLWAKSVKTYMNMNKMISADDDNARKHEDQVVF